MKVIVNDCYIRIDVGEMQFGPFLLSDPDQARELEGAFHCVSEASQNAGAELVRTSYLAFLRNLFRLPHASQWELENHAAKVHALCGRLQAIAYASSELGLIDRAREAVRCALGPFTSEFDGEQS